MIYLDHHAATPLSEVSRAAIDTSRDATWANPSSVHAAGRRSRAALETARRHLAEALSVDARDVVFTSGGTEAVQLAVWGATQGLPGHLITTTVEHPAVSAAVALAEKRGWNVSRLDVPRGVPPNVETFAAALRPETRAVVIQAVNHETGTVLPVHEYARSVAGRGIVFAVDAAQALGKTRFDLGPLGAAFVAFTAQKIGGPSGIGATVVARGVDFDPLQPGGGQERGRRGGTPDVANAVAFGAAARHAATRFDAMGRVGELRDDLEAGLVRLGGHVNAGESERVATVTNVSFEGVRSDLLVAALDVEGVCISAGAACSSGVATGSAVLHAMYPDEPWRASGASRWSLGVETTREEVTVALSRAAAVLLRLNKTKQ